MWHEEKDRTRVYRIGTRPYHRANYIPSTVPRQIDERLHTRGLSTSSNSSWTFSNGHAELPKNRRNSVCGAILIAAIFIVVAAVICVGGLAFYMGAKRVESSSANLVLDGNLRITYGDQFKADLLDASSQLFLDKADKYQQMLSIVLKKTVLQQSLKEIAVMKFINGSHLHVGFRIHLDRRKIPEGVNAMEIVRKALAEEFASVKPIAFRNMQVDLHRLVPNNGEEESHFESAQLDNNKKAEVKNGILRKHTSETAASQPKTKTNLTPVKGTSVKMVELGETIKLKNDPKLSETTEEVKSIEFKDNDDLAKELEIVREIVKEVIREPEMTTIIPTPKPVSTKPAKIYQSIYITSDNVRISNNSKPESPVGGSFKISKPSLVDYQTAAPSVAGSAVGTYKITIPESSVKSDVIFAEVTEKPVQSKPLPTVPAKVPTREPSTVQLIRATTWSPSVNGHARPVKDAVPNPVNVGFSLAGSSPEDEPWRPIIPSRMVSSTSSTTELVDTYDSLVMDKDTVEDEIDSINIPITFSKKVYDDNLRIAPEVAEKSKNKNTKLSKITEEIAKKYKEIVKQQTVVEPTTKLLTSTTTTTASPSSSTTTSSISTTSTTTTTTTTTTTAMPPTTEIPSTVVVNPFKEVDDSRSSSILSFGLPELPIIQQFHHLDSLLKSFSGGTAAGGSPPIKINGSVMFTTPIPRVTEASTLKITTKPTILKTTTIKETTSNNLKEMSSTRFPMRRKQNETVYVAVSTFTPAVKLRSTIEDSTEKMKISSSTTTTKKSIISTEGKTTKLELSSTKAFSTSTRKSPLDYSSTTPSSTTQKSEPFVVKGEVEVLDQPTAEADVTTEQARLVTLLPVRSNVNMRTPLRPRPPTRRGRVQPEGFFDDENGKRWVYYSSSKLTNPPEKLFIVTPEPEAKKSPADLPIYNTIEQLLNTDHRDRLSASSKNTSEIVQRIVSLMDNIAIASENSSSVIVKINSTVLRKTVVPDEIKKRSDVVNSIISTKAVSSGGSNYKLNQAGVPILTKVLKKDPVSVKSSHPIKEERNTSIDSSTGHIAVNALNEQVSSHIHPTECKNNSVRCSNGICLPPASRCNQLVDCPDASDEKNCTCAEHLKAQRLNRKICDGVVDCWDFSDEHDCDWCKPEQYLCTNSRACINMSEVCDGVAQCPHGDDERSCVRIAPTIDLAGPDYHSSGFLMVRKHGVWGKLCVDDFDSVTRDSQTGWKLSDVGKSVCRALTYRDFDKVERVFSIPNEGRAASSNSSNDNFFKLSIEANNSKARETSLSFHDSKCSGRQVAKVTCTDLECGLRPQVSSQWSRIVGGGNASPGAWPWQAALYREGEFQCGATLVSSTWLISAGHCFYHNQEEWWVARLGALRTSSSLPSPHEQIRSVAQVIVHPQYVDSGFLNDIALLRLAEPVRLTDHVRPICLPSATALVRDGAICTVVGWGQLFELGRVFPDTLQEVQVPLISSAECRKRTLFLPLYRVTDDMLCAGYERGGRDACLGDSGGPLMCQEKDSRWTLYGVTSNGYGCARSNRPGVYTKVTRYHSWIHARIQVDTQNITARDRVDRCKGHRCPLGECLPRTRLCNGYVECSDGSDEKDCW